MRQVLQNISNQGRNNPDHHVGLAYDIWAPLVDRVNAEDDNNDQLGHISKDHKQKWLERVADTAIDPDYQQAFARWKNSFDLQDRTCELILQSRLLVGHGNQAPTEVGLSIHHTWGVPVIPGSALKGLCAHYVETMFGPDAPTAEPWKDEERGDYQGVLWKDKRIKAGPGEVYRALFGAPDAEADEEYQRQGEEGYLAGASRGLVTFHDALYVPGTCRQGQDDKPFAVDVLTVHQKSYYNAAGQNNQPEPNDYDDPNPVGFLSVRPRAQFLLALSGPREWVELAEYFLSEALEEWGIGGKTAAGYGHGQAGEWKNPEPPASSVFADFETWIREKFDGSRSNKIAYIAQHCCSELVKLSIEEREKTADLIENDRDCIINKNQKKHFARRAAILQALRSAPSGECPEE